MENNQVPEVGTILYSSWGYDQTNIEFYKVVKVSEKSVWIQELKNQIVEQVGFMSEKVVPSDEFRKGGWVKAPDGIGQVYDPDYIAPPERKLWSKHGGVRLSSFQSAWIWDGQSKYASHYA